VTRVARVSVFGKTIGGLDVESSEFMFVIGVCNGCLLRDCADDEELLACLPGQDALTCRGR
jgi:hypothetical protein